MVLICVRHQVLLTLYIAMVTYHVCVCVCVCVCVQVEVIDHEEPGAVKEVLTEGSYFGDKSLLYNTPMESTVRAITHVDMFTFSQTDYEKVKIKIFHPFDQFLYALITPHWKEL